MNPTPAQPACVLTTTLLLPPFHPPYRRTADANNPDIMFFCSLCGCRADQHAVDALWQAQEAARRADEAAAAERRASAAGATAAAAAAAARREAEAYAELGLPLGADAKSVARAYKRLALRLHPDKQQQVQAAAQPARSAPAGKRQGFAGGGSMEEARQAAARDRFHRVAAAYQLLTERPAGGR